MNLPNVATIEGIPTLAQVVELIRRSRPNDLHQNRVSAPHPYRNRRHNLFLSDLTARLWQPKVADSGLADLPRRVPMVNDSKAQSECPESQQPFKRDTKLILVVPRLTTAILKALKAQQNEPKGVIVNRLVEVEGLRVLGREQVDSIKQLSIKRKG
jgi:hypothetical protein